MLVLAPLHYQCLMYLDLFSILFNTKSFLLPVFYRCMEKFLCNCSTLALHVMLLALASSGHVLVQYTDFSGEKARNLFELRYF